ncbi:hypothetical protein KC640_00250 [Candidatus Dojkabacteria bacterium]|uniref:Cadherin repeat domain-containing protein n=1 Tax=Candidatus Dojkabacteria bacterium TaxID=2099670 RepID=A0A955I5B0_9BACT|nr:hypothetical protein [Candidatus Dojkabacteria bacterium]
MKLLRKNTILGVGLLLLLAPLMPALAASQLLADPNDYFQVYSPGPESRVTGSSSVAWQVTDADSGNIPFQINLKDVGSCSVVQHNLASGTVPSSANQISTNWNSAAYADGAYCIEVCVNLHLGADPYISCNARTIYIRNTNHAPQILTNPGSPVIQTTQAWSHDVNAIDADGDSLSYALAAAPGFVTINSVNGVIAVNAAAKPVGSYSITVNVTDSFGATTQQTFTLTVIAPSAPAPENQTSDGQTPVTLEITSPNASSEFWGTANQLSWELSGTSRVTSLSIYYAANSGEWVKLVDLGKTETKYVWDVSEIVPGDYQVMLVARLNDGSEVTTTSPTFKIINTPSQQTDKPVIYDVLPSDGSEIRDTKPSISGKYLPAIGHEIIPATFKLTIDGTEHSDKCEATNMGFKCQLDNELASGEHQLQVSVDDTSAQTASHSWSFQITGQTSAADQEQTVNVLGQTLAYRSLIWVLVICCALLFLLIVPWLLYRLWKNRDEDDAKVDDSAWQYTTSNPDNPTQPNVEVNYVYPGVIENNSEVADQTSRELAELGIAPQVAAQTEPSWLAPEDSKPSNITVNVGVPEPSETESGSFGYASRVDD